MCSTNLAAQQKEGGVTKESRKDLPTMTKIYRRIIVNFRWFIGLGLFLNFMTFWAMPIGVQGQLWKLGITRTLLPIYTFFDENKWCRAFANKFVYSKEVYSDFFALSVGLTLSTFASFATVLYHQVKYDHVPLWMIYAYYFMWVGLGGRGMGGAYTLTHKEGHNRNGGLYKDYIAKRIGNYWENWMGFFYGNVPFLFSTSHIYLHHRLNAGKGDPFYQWDCDRSSWTDFMFYVYRSCVGYMTGWESLKTFNRMAPTNKTMAGNFDMLRRGCIWFWIVVPSVASCSLLAAGCSVASTLRFLLLIYLEPFLAMSFFLAFINFGLHGFIEFDAEGKHYPCVNSSCIIEGEDDYFGEDDHMAHHYHTAVNHRDLVAHQETQKEIWKDPVASVFKKLSILELGLFVLLKEWKRLATLHFVDSSGKLSVDEIADLLKVRAERVEMSYEEYEFEYLPRLHSKAQQLVDEGKCVSVDQGLKVLAHSNILLEHNSSKTD